MKLTEIKMFFIYNFISVNVYFISSNEFLWFSFVNNNTDTIYNIEMFILALMHTILTQTSQFADFKWTLIYFPLVFGSLGVWLHFILRFNSCY